MAVQTLPDLLGCIVARLRSFPEILAFVSTSNGYTDDATPTQKARPRVSAELQASWKLPYPAVLVSGPVGGPGGERDSALQATRIDLHCYGQSAYEAMRLWRQVHPCLCPVLHQGVAESFIQAGVGVATIDMEGGPIRLVEPDTKYPKVVASYIVRWAEQVRP